MTTRRASTPPRLLLEGPPRIGKSTLARRLIALCLDVGLEVHGFTTDELRTGGRREGFEVVPVGGGPGTLLAHVDLPGPPTVGRYGVDLPTFEAVALPLLRPQREGVVIVDELGAMELASDAFRRAVETLFRSEVPVVATVHTKRDRLTDRLRRRADVEVVAVTSEHRDRLPGELAARLRAWARWAGTAS